MPLPELTLELAFENHTCYPAKGELLYYPGFISVREILIPYGASVFGSKVGLLPGNHFATITEGLDALETLGDGLDPLFGDLRLDDECELVLSHDPSWTEHRGRRR